MRYVKARVDTEFRELTYRIFVTDYLKGIGRFNGGPRYAEAITNSKQPIETRSSEEIIDSISEKLSRLGGNDGCT